MPAIHYLAELDKITTFNAYRQIIEDMTKTQLEIVLLMILNAVDVEYAFDAVIGRKHERGHHQSI